MMDDLFKDVIDNAEKSFIEDKKQKLIRGVDVKFNTYPQSKKAIIGYLDIEDVPFNIRFNNELLLFFYLHNNYKKRIHFIKFRLNDLESINLPFWNRYKTYLEERLCYYE